MLTAGTGRSAAPRTELSPGVLGRRMRAKWAGGDRDTWQIAEELGITEAEVCGMLLRPGERRESCAQAREAAE